MSATKSPNTKISKPKKIKADKEISKLGSISEFQYGSIKSSSEAKMKMKSRIPRATNLEMVNDKNEKRKEAVSLFGRKDLVEISLSD